MNDLQIQILKILKEWGEYDEYGFWYGYDELASAICEPKTKQELLAELRALKSMGLVCIKPIWYYGDRLNGSGWFITVAGKERIAE